MFCRIVVYLYTGAESSFSCTPILFVSFVAACNQNSLVHEIYLARAHPKRGDYIFRTFPLSQLLLLNKVPG